MGRERKSAWERNQVARATVVRRHTGVPPRVGRVYEAFSEASGKPVLLVAPGNTGEWGHLPELGVRLTASAEEGCYALEVEKPPVGRGLPELTLALYRTAHALAQVEEKPEAVEAVLGHLARQRQQRARVRRAVPAAVAAAVVAGLVALWVWGGQHALTERVVLNAGAAGGAEGGGAPLEEASTQLGEVAARAGPVAVAARQAVGGLRLDLPKKPWPGQNVAPCEPEETEITLRSGERSCWIKVDRSPQLCKTKGYEYKGGCYLPSYPPPKVPQSEQP